MIHSPEVNAGLTTYSQNEQASSIRDTSANWTALAEMIPAVLSELPDLQTEMLPHQVDGLSWLVGLHDMSFNGILADEMGVPPFVGQPESACTYCYRLWCLFGLSTNFLDVAVPDPR